MEGEKVRIWIPPDLTSMIIIYKGNQLSAILMKEKRP
jgi:hypothetical protein